MIKHLLVVTTTVHMYVYT